MCMCRVKTNRVSQFVAVPELINHSSWNFTSAQECSKTAILIEELSWLKGKGGKMQIYKNLGTGKSRPRCFSWIYKSITKYPNLDSINESIEIISACHCTDSTYSSIHSILLLYQKTVRFAGLCKWKTMEKFKGRL